MDILGVISETPFFDPFFRNDQNGWKVPLMRDHHFGSDRDPKKGVQKWSKIGHFWDPKYAKNVEKWGIFSNFDDPTPSKRQKWHFRHFRVFLSFFDKKMTKSSKNRTRFFRSKTVQPKNVKNDKKCQKWLKSEKLHILIN